MTFSDAEYEAIESMAAAGYGPRDIAIYLEVNPQKFYNKWSKEEDTYVEGTIRYHYEKGILQAKADSDIKIVESARSGNITARQMMDKRIREQEWIQKLASTSQMDAPELGILNFPNS